MVNVVSEILLAPHVRLLHPVEFFIIRCHIRCIKSEVLRPHSLAIFERLISSTIREQRELDYFILRLIRSPLFLKVNYILLLLL